MVTQIWGHSTGTFGCSPLLWSKHVKVNDTCYCSAYEVKADSNRVLHYVIQHVQFRAISDQLPVVVRTFRGSEAYFVLTGGNEASSKDKLLGRKLRSTSRRQSISEAKFRLVASCPASAPG
jgi:hypothetical protein